MPGRKRASPDANTEKDGDKKKEKLAGDDADFSWIYDEVRHVYVGHYRSGAQPSDKIAAFDFDGTLSVPRSGKTFPKDGQDFQLLSEQLPKRLREVTNGRSFIIFTNQMGVGKHTTSQAVRDRISGILRLIGPIPCTVFASTLENEYRKPRRGMFDLFLKHYNGEIGVDLKQSVYVGDAAGRKKTTSYPKKDHSNADYLFAINCGLNFMTPEQFLAGNSVELAQKENENSLPRPTHDPKQWLSQPLSFGWSAKENLQLTDDVVFTSKWKNICSLDRIIVVMIGVPGSGKSHFVHRFCTGLQIVSRDKAGTMEKCEQEVVAATENDTCHVVVDNTNFDLESRKRWLSIANRTACTPVAVCLNVTLEQALHNNYFRRLAALRSGHDSAQMVPTFVIRNQANKLIEPTLTEGFADVFKINFVPHFTENSLRDLYTCYL